MPAPRICPEPGCPTFTTGGRCARHQALGEKSRGTARQRGYTARWERFRRHYLRRHPQCVSCGSTATDVDHVDGLGPLGPRGYDPANLRALCHPCHSARTAVDQPGGWNAR